MPITPAPARAIAAATVSVASRGTKVTTFTWAAGSAGPKPDTSSSPKAEARASAVPPGAMSKDVWATARATPALIRRQARPAGEGPATSVTVGVNRRGW